MKLMNEKRPVMELPNAETVYEMIMNLSAPVQVMGWLMAETGCRLSDLISMRVSDFSKRNSTIKILSETGRRNAVISVGLRDALDAYMNDLREKFEGCRRGRNVSSTCRPGLVQMFSDQRLFPAWSLAGNERALLDQAFPTEVFVQELQDAAVYAGYRGMIHSNTLRLCCAFRWVSEGMNMCDLHERLGHKDLLTTMMMVQALRADGLSFTPVCEQNETRELESVA